MNAASNKKLQPLLITVLCLAILFALYYYGLKPKMDEVKSQEVLNNSYRQEIKMVQQQITAIEQSQQYVASEKNDFEIRKLLPGNRDIERLLLNFEEIEYVTNTRINNISFNNYDATVASSALRDPAESASPPEQAVASNPEGPNVEMNAENQGATNQEMVNQPTPPNESVETPETPTTNPTTNTEQPTEGTVTPITSISATILPANLKLITFDLSMQAPTKEELLAFVKEVEKLERKIHIDQMNFALGGEEEGFSEADPTAVNVRLLLTTFYYE